MTDRLEYPRDYTSIKKTHPLNTFEQRLEQTEKALQKAEQQARRRGQLPFKLGATAVVVLSFVNAYWQDVEANKLAESRTNVTVSESLASIDALNPHHGTIVIDGFNAYDATHISGVFGPSIQRISNDDVLSLNYNNAPLEREAILDEVVDYAEEHDLTSVSVIGYSMGGIIGTELARDLNTKSDISVPYALSIETPYGYDGLREYQKGELSFGQKLTSIIPDSEYSSWGRKAGEIYFFREAYTKGTPLENVHNFLDISAKILTEPAPERLTTSRLLMQQIAKIAQVDFKEEFKAIREQSGNKPKTVFGYIKTSGYDAVVDDAYSGFQYCADASEAQLDCDVFTVKDAQHSVYFNSLPEFDATFKEVAETFQPQLEIEASISNFKRQIYSRNVLRYLQYLR